MLMKVLLFGDGPQHKEKAKTLREQNGWTVQLRSIHRWAGEVESVDAAYFLAPADTIRAAYKARGIDCFLVEESKEGGADAVSQDANSAEAKAAPASESASPVSDDAAVGEAPKAAEGEEGASGKAPDAKPERPAGKKGK
jgi:hypothetical protein